VRGKQLDAVRFLVEQGADITQQTSDGKSALQVAREQDFVEIANYLLAQGAR